MHRAFPSTRLLLVDRGSRDIRGHASLREVGPVPSWKECQQEGGTFTEQVGVRSAARLNQGGEELFRLM